MRLDPTVERMVVSCVATAGVGIGCAAMPTLLLDTAPAEAGVGTEVAPVVTAS